MKTELTTNATRQKATPVHLGGAFKLRGVTQRSCRTIIRIVFVLVAFAVAVPAATGASEVSIEGTYDLYDETGPWFGVVTQMTIFGQRDGYFLIRGIDQDWEGQGRIEGLQGYYDWKFGDGKTGRTTFSVNKDGTLRGQVLGAGIKWTYIARPQSSNSMILVLNY